MMITCAASGCPSTQTTKIDGNLISFFAFPEDDLRKNQWLHNCNLASGIVSERESCGLHLCELHFEKVNFTASRDLKSNAVPTLFGRIEEPPKKRKLENVVQTVPAKAPPFKQKKIDEHSHTLVTPPQSPFMQLTDNAEDPTSGIKDVSVDHAVAMNGSMTSSSITSLQMHTKTYRLMIQIDKMRSKPGPKCKKLVPLIMLNNDAKHLTMNMHEIVRKDQPPLQKLVKRACAKGSCRLKECIFGSRPALQCELCDKYYVTKRKEDKSYSCSICSKTFLNSQLLYVHVRKHFICDICQTECSSQMTYDKHVRLHVSTDPLYPYKCHQCAKIFDLKESVKQHCSTEHPKIKLQTTTVQITPSSVATKVRQQSEYRCVNCNISFQHDQSYRNHMSAHKRKESLRCNIGETNNIIPVPNPLTGSQIGILQAVKFSCRVCSKEFDNVGEVDVHTRTHLEDAEEGLNCKICKQSFKTNAAFSEHLKHHLSRAHPCPICSKAFINGTTLQIHLKTHPES
ncbi:hypothetical protein DMN91_002365 [Ooceraea biroi]|uniref:Zinc finger protein n=1 Tax=Ooceraea biroi TaxID=2015173 RepID=A0A3L8E1Y1_OOCBI|nr:zinc finger protein 555 isoform X1 [Ooceraea biroi]RLU26199.1 hypothetical protein DMN91_002365 [Ooceraea biroi]